MDNGADSYRRFCENDDENALAELIDEYKDGLILYLNSIVGNISAAAEIAEDTFVLLGVKMPKYRGKSRFRTWLYAIGRNSAMDFLRRRMRRNEISIDDTPEQISDRHDIEEAYIREEEKIAVHRAMDSLRCEYRQVLWLIYFEELSIREAAAIMKKSVHSTEMLVSRARKSLKKQLETEGFSYEKF